MRLLLVRHGNTFAPGDKVVWVGANEDLPLVGAGIAQAEALGRALAPAGLIPTRVICGPLKRTRTHAEAVMAAAGLAGNAEVDTRLREIDYGPWGGLTDAEIEDRFGADAAQELAQWQSMSRWPRDTVTWRPGEAAIRDQLRALVADLVDDLAGNPSSGPGGDDLVLLCSSNGILRYFLEFTEGGLARAVAAGNHKMATGAASLLDFQGTRAEVVFWNRKADAWT